MFSDSVANICGVIFSVFPEIREEFFSSSLMAWRADFSAAFIQLLISSYWEGILFSTGAIQFSRFANFSSMRVLSYVIGSARELIEFGDWESLFAFGICTNNNSYYF